MGTRLECNSVSHPYNHAADGAAVGDRSGTADQNDKGGLEGIFRVRRVPQQTVADAPHVPGMSLHQMLERLLVMMFEEVRQEARVRPLIQPLSGCLQQHHQGRRSCSQVTLAIAFLPAVVDIVP